MITHLTSGDSAAHLLQRGGITEPIIVWRDLCYQGPRFIGMPEREQLQQRAHFLSAATQAGVTEAAALASLQNQYRSLGQAVQQGQLVLWFDACLHDQSLLAHILVCLAELNASQVELICIDDWPSIKPYHGLGQLDAADLVSCRHKTMLLIDKHFTYANEVERAIVYQDQIALTALADQINAPLPWMPAALKRLLAELPGQDGLVLLARLAFTSIQSGVNKPDQIFHHVAAADTPPQYWGDTTLWATINQLADRQLVKIDGPNSRLPQWYDDDTSINDFTISIVRT